MTDVAHFFLISLTFDEQEALGQYDGKGMLVKGGPCYTGRIVSNSVVVGLIAIFFFSAGFLKSAYARMTR